MATPCLVKTLSQSQFIASESYHMTSLPKLRLCEKQFQVIYTTASYCNPSVKRSSDLFSIFLLMRSNHNANTNILWVTFFSNNLPQSVLHLIAHPITPCTAWPEVYAFTESFFFGILGLIKVHLHSTFLKWLVVMHSTSHLHDIFSFFEINLYYR